MKLIVTDQQNDGEILLINDEPNFDRFFYTRDKDKRYFTIAWNYGEGRNVTVDGIVHRFNANTILPLMFNQSFAFEDSKDIVAWQFNREFYCIMDHDDEVSCAGFLFGMGDQLFIDLDESISSKLRLLLNIFIEELRTKDSIQKDMLVMLLKRLILIVTALAKKNYVPDLKLQDERFDLFRKFNLLVEANFSREHTVNYYANQLNKSPKTLANLFALYNQNTPIQVIQLRIVTEARRLLYYTSKSVKEITYELGFDDPAYFSNFFKRHTSVSPVEYRNTRVLTGSGK